MPRNRRVELINERLANRFPGPADARSPERNCVTDRVIVKLRVHRNFPLTVWPRNGHVFAETEAILIILWSSDYPSVRWLPVSATQPANARCTFESFRDPEWNIEARAFNVLRGKTNKLAPAVWHESRIAIRVPGCFSWILFRTNHWNNLLRIIVMFLFYRIRILRFLWSVSYLFISIVVILHFSFQCWISW